MKKRIFSMLLALVMVFSMIPTSAFAVGTGTEQAPYQVGDTVTNDGSAEPEGAKAENTHWERSDVAAVQTTICQTAEHDHGAAGCTAAYETVECLQEGHPTGGETAFTHEDGTVCSFDAENGQWLTTVEAGYTCGIEAHTHTVEDGCITEVPGYTVWTLAADEASSPAQDDQIMLAAQGDDGSLPIHFFLASPGNINNPNGTYTNYYVPMDDDDNDAWTIPDIKNNAAWSTMYSQNGIRNVSDESIITQYVGSWPYGDEATFKDFGSVRIGGTTYYDTDYEIKWVSIMCRDNAHSSYGMHCNQSSYRGEHIHIDGLLVEKILPGDMEVYKTIPTAAAADTTFQFTLQKLLQPDLTSKPTSGDAIDESFAPMTLTASISAGQTEAQIVGGDEISFGYYKLTENSSTAWENDGIVLTDSRGRTQTVDTDTLYICIAPNGEVLYSTSVSGTYTAMEHVAVQNARKAVQVNYQWKVLGLDGSYAELPAGAPAVPAAESVAYGTQYVYNTSYVDGTSFSDYETGLMYTFRGWDVYTHNSAFTVDASAAGNTKLDDGDAIASNNKTIPMTADTYINGYWEVSQMPPADAHIAVAKTLMLDGEVVEPEDLAASPIAAANKLWIRVDPGIDLDGDGVSQVDIDYSMIQADQDGEYKLPVYQYAKPFTFTEQDADIPGFTRTTEIQVEGENAELLKAEGVYAEVELDPVYQDAKGHLGTITYINKYTKNVGAPVTEYPTLTLVKRATDTGHLQADAQFTLYRDADCTTPIMAVTTDEDGVASIDFATITPAAETYYLKETSAPEGYVLDDTVYTLTLTSSTAEELRNNQFVEVTTYTLTIAVPAGSDAVALQSAADAQKYSLNVFNAPILGQVTVAKASRGLYEDDVNLMEATVTIHGPITRNAQDYITGLGNEYTLILNEDNAWLRELDQLPLGEYLIHENMASVHGYTWDMNNVDYGGLNTEVYNNITSGVFEITPDSTNIRVEITNSYERWASADFYIYKTDPNGTHLSGAAFQLYADEGCTTQVTDPAVTTNGVTAANGYAWFSGFTVPAGDEDGIVTYYLKETRAPAGYYLSDTVYKVEIKAITADGVTTYEPKISVKLNGNWVEADGFSSTSDTLHIVNTPVKGSLTITKTMNGAPADLESVAFYVSGSNGYARSVTLTRADNWTVTLTDLPLGTYTVIEQNADAPGYDLVTTYSVDGTVTTDKATVVLSQTNPGTTVTGTVFSGTAEITNTYTIRQTSIENPTSLTVKKVGENGEALAGAVFTLVRDRDGAKASYTTNDKGEVQFSFLSGTIENGQIVEGKYTLTETKAPDGYAKSDTVWKVTVKEDDDKVTIKLNEDTNIFENIWDWIIGGITDGTYGYVFENNTLTVMNVELADLTINKFFAHKTNETEDIVPEAGAIIEVAVFDADGALVEQMELSAENEWSAKLSDLPAGTYTIRENSPSLHGYTWHEAKFAVSVNAELQENIEKNDASSVKVTIHNSDDVAVNITNAYTKWEAADFYVMKTDTEGNPLAGAQFELYEGSYESADEIDEAKKVTDAYLHTDSTIHTNEGNVTGSGGILHFSGFVVEEGQTKTFTLKETKAPGNYYENANVYKIVISHTADGYGLTVQENDDNASFNQANDVLTVVNEEILADLTIQKTFSADNRFVPNSVKVDVTGPNGYSETVTLGTRNNYAVTLTDLSLGEYTVKEQDASQNGYALTVKYNGQIAEQATVQLTVANDNEAAGVNIQNTYLEDIHNPASFTIKKVDAQTQQPLEGAVFGLYDTTGTLVGEAKTTNADGIVTFGPFSSAAEYTLKETSAPENYNKTDAVWTVTVKEKDGQVEVKLNQETNLFENIYDWIVDVVSKGQTTAAWEDNVLTVPNVIKVGSLTVTKEAFDKLGLYADAAYSFTLDCSDDAFDKTFTLNSGESITIKDIPWGTTYTLTEDTRDAAFISSIADGVKGTIQNETVTCNVTNSYVYTTHNAGLNLIKVDTDDNTKAVEGAGFTLYDEDGKAVGAEVFSDADGKVNIPIAAAGTYTLKETTTPEGYHPNKTGYVVTAKEEPVVMNAGTANAVTEMQMHIAITGLTGTTDNQIDYTYAIENTAIKHFDVSVEKKWEDGGYHARPESVEAVLLRDGETYDTKELNAANGWKYTWEDLTDEHTWSVDEKEASSEYIKSVTNGEHDWTITNTRTPKAVEITVTKAWNHNGGKNLPESIQVTLYADGEAKETVTLNEANGWTHTWTGLTDVSVWSVDEVEVPAGYTKTVKVDGCKFTITNTRTINPVEVSVTKNWVASEGVVHPESIEAVLLRDGKEFKTVKLSAENSWTYKWTGLTDEYTWSVDEKAVPDGYTKNVTNRDNDFTITNTRNFKNIDVSVEKVWYGANVTHPTSVQVTLYRDGAVYDTVKLDASNGWKHVWKDLTDEFVWTVDEPSVPRGYTKEVKNLGGYVFQITNTHEDIPKTGDNTDVTGLAMMGTVGILGFLATAFCLLPRKKGKYQR